MDPLEGTLTPLAGGHSGETFLAETAAERSVVRIYGPRSADRGPHAAEVDAAVLRLVRGLLPVPEVLEVRRANDVAGTPPLLVTSYLPGERLDVALPGMSDELRHQVGIELGRMLARLSQMPMLRGGAFIDGDLRIGDFPAAAADLEAWLDGNLTGTALASWEGSDVDGLRAVARRAQDLLDRLDRVSLVHSDFNPKNVLVEPGTGEVTGLLDWEFAHAGLPVADLGNLLRFDREPVFMDAVVSTFCSLVPPLPGDVLDLARAADLYALIDLAARRDDNVVARRAHDQLLGVARTGDLHADLHADPDSLPDRVP